MVGMTAKKHGTRDLTCPSFAFPLELELALELDPHHQSRSQKTEDRIQN
jgi:hypothetical protein